MAVAAPRSRTVIVKGRAAGTGNNEIRGTTAAAAAAEPPEFQFPIDTINSLHGGHVEEDISVEKLGFPSCYPSVADETLAGDGGRRVRRRRVMSMKEVGGRERVVGSGDEVQGRRRRCLLQWNFPRKKKTIVGLSRTHAEHFFVFLLTIRMK